MALTLPRPDVIFAPSPPLTIGANAWLIGALRRCPYIYNVQEIYPDAAIALGALHNPVLIRSLYALERFVYHRAGLVTVIAPHMRDRLLRKGTPGAKLAVIPNFVDIEELAPLPKDNAFSREHGLVHAFVVSYAGNMGPAQQLETFIAAAERLQDEKSIRFLMMGDGILREQLRATVAEKKLDNFTFLPYQRYSLMRQIYATSDLSLVPQAEGIADIAVPSKVYRIMACGRPVLALALEESDLGDLLRESGAGLLVRPGSAESLAAAIRERGLRPTAAGPHGRGRPAPRRRTLHPSGRGRTVLRSDPASDRLEHGRRERESYSAGDRCKRRARSGGREPARRTRVSGARTRVGGTGRRGLHDQGGVVHGGYLRRAAARRGDAGRLAAWSTWLRCCTSTNPRPSLRPSTSGSTSRERRPWSTRPCEATRRVSFS